jgi:hypothetical protein
MWYVNIYIFERNDNMKKLRFHMKSSESFDLLINEIDSKLSISQFIEKYFPNMSNQINWYGGEDISILLNEVEALEILE